MKVFVNLIRDGWADQHSPLLRMFSTVFLPGGSAEQIKWYGDLLRTSTSAENVLANWSVSDDIDVVDLLPKVSAPTLVLHCRHDNAAPFDEGRRIATSIPNAKFVSLELREPRSATGRARLVTIRR